MTDLLLAIFIFLVFLLVVCHNKKEQFSAENVLLHRNPFDDVDYIRPSIVMLKRT